MVDWDLVVVSTESMSMGVWVREESTLEHLTVGGLNSWYEIIWREC